MAKYEYLILTKTYGLRVVEEKKKREGRGGGRGRIGRRRRAIKRRMPTWTGRSCNILLLSTVDLASFVFIHFFA